MGRGTSGATLRSALHEDSNEIPDSVQLHGSGTALAHEFRDAFEVPSDLSPPELCRQLRDPVLGTQLTWLHREQSRDLSARLQDRLAVPGVVKQRVKLLIVEDGSSLDVTTRSRTPPLTRDFDGADRDQERQ